MMNYVSFLSWPTQSQTLAKRGWHGKVRFEIMCQVLSNTNCWLYIFQQATKHKHQCKNTNAKYKCTKQKNIIKSIRLHEITWVQQRLHTDFRSPRASPCSAQRSAERWVEIVKSACQVCGVGREIKQPAIKTAEDMQVNLKLNQYAVLYMKYDIWCIHARPLWKTIFNIHQHSKM